jgi:hypothetical protein
MGGRRNKEANRKLALSQCRQPTTAGSTRCPEADRDARVMILEAGRATFELADGAQVDMIDQIEVGRRVSPHIRLAFTANPFSRTERPITLATNNRSYPHTLIGPQTRDTRP